MGFMLRCIPPHAKLTDQISLDALETAVPRDQVKAVVANLGVGEQRQGKLTAEVGVLLSVVMNFFTSDSLHQVLVKLIQGVRFIWPDPNIVPASKSAISQARYRLGARPVVELFRRVCQPMAIEATPGAFLFGLRRMAIDGTTEDVPDTLANSRAFGRHRGRRGIGAFPQVRGVYLIECATHAIVDAGFWPYGTSERVGGLGLLRSVPEGMLLMGDRGLHSFEMVQKTHAKGAQFLSRVPRHVQLKPLHPRSDGSYLA
jgi:hypothetical protein